MSQTPKQTSKQKVAKQLPELAPQSELGQENWLHKLLGTFFNPSTGTTAFAIVVALLLGALIVVSFDEDTQTAAGYFFAQPSDFFASAGEAFARFFTALIRGSIFDWQQTDPAQAFRPLTESLVRATPLILAGLAVAVSFRAGLFNIGVQGQLIFGAILCGYLGFAFELPVGLHVVLTVLGAIIGGAIGGFIPGILKAKLDANEVIVTIMMNSVASLLLSALLSTVAFHGEGGYAGKSSSLLATAVYPLLLGSRFRLHFGFIVAILACVLVWWLIDRSKLGFEIRAAGANPQAARTAGINVTRTLLLTLVISGALAGLAATAPVLGTEKSLSVGLAGSIGFDAITVALLGKSKPLGVFFAGLLFGALNAGGALMQSSAGIPVDIVQITQAIIVLMIAGSEAIRYMRKRRRETETAAKNTQKGEPAVEVESKPVTGGAGA